MTLVRNSVLSLMPNLIGVALSITTVPLYVSMVGTERYGALLLAFVLLGYFGQADFGLGRAITQRLSSMSNPQPDEQASIVWSAIAGASLISIIGAIIFFVSAHQFFQSFFDATESLRAEVLSSIWLFALCVPVIMFTGVASGALTGLERFGVVSIGTMIGNVLSQILPLVVAALHSVEFQWLLAASLAGRIIGLAPIMYSMGIVFLRDQPVNVSWTQMRSLFSYGSWIMVTAIVSPLMVSADRIVIGAVLGAAAVVAYSVPVQIALRTIMFPSAVVQALFPRLASHDVDSSNALGKSAAVFVGQIYAFVIVGLICLASPLLSLWLGSNLDPRSTLVGQITLVGFWMNALANVPYALIQAQGNSRFTALLHVLELPIFVLMLYAFGTSLGLYGVALAFTVRMAIDCIALFQKGGFIDAGVIARLVGPGIVIAAAFVTSQWMLGWLLSIASASFYCLILVVLTWFQMPGEAKDWLTQRMRR